MGMSASQGRFLGLTQRDSFITFELAQLSNDKVEMAREAQKAADEYNDALNAKYYRWSNNSGVSYIDLTYKNLMNPSLMNQNKPYLLTDCQDRIIIDSNYKKYAEMISSDGAANGNWENVRSKVLAELTGLDESKINSSDSYRNEILNNESSINKMIEDEPIKPTKKTNTQTFIENLGTTANIGAFSKGSSWADAYSMGGTLNLGTSSVAASNLQKVLDQISSTLGKYIDDPENLKEACQTFYDAQIGIINDSKSEGNKQSLSSDQTPLNGNFMGFNINVTQMIDTILGSYAQLNGHVDRSGYNNSYMFTWNDIDSEKYQTWEKKHAEWQKTYDELNKNYESNINSNNTLFTADEESLIKFYDGIFSSIAEKGWTYNEQINDPEYLNQMLQNNLYMITSVDRDYEYNNNNGSYEWDNEYSTNIASNCTNIFSVNNSDLREAAMVKYENIKRKISEKETRIDNRMQNLQTEQAAIKQMLQSIQKVINDNIERTFSTNG